MSKEDSGLGRYLPRLIYPEHPRWLDYDHAREDGSGRHTGWVFNAPVLGEQPKRGKPPSWGVRRAVLEVPAEGGPNEAVPEVPLPGTTRSP